MSQKQPSQATEIKSDPLNSSFIEYPEADSDFQVDSSNFVSDSYLHQGNSDDKDLSIFNALNHI